MSDSQAEEKGRFCSLGLDILINVLDVDVSSSTRSTAADATSVVCVVVFASSLDVAAAVTKLRK